MHLQRRKDQVTRQLVKRLVGHARQQFAENYHPEVGIDGGAARFLCQRGGEYQGASFCGAGDVRMGAVE